MTKNEFISEIISAIETLSIEHLSDCYDVTSYVHELVEKMTSDYEIEWNVTTKETE